MIESLKERTRSKITNHKSKIKNLIPALLLLITGCFSADRSNPLDPVRIEAVALLSVTFDSPSQTVTLVWTPYHGGDPFLRYEVERRETGTGPVVLAIMQAWADTSFVDTTVQPHIAYTYRVVVRNQAGLPAPSNAMNGRMGIPIRIFGPLFDSGTATAEISWTRFTGGDFLSYELTRNTTSLAVIQDAADTAFTDTGLATGERYTYHVALNRTNGTRFVISSLPGGL